MKNIQTFENKEIDNMLNDTELRKSPVATTEDFLNRIFHVTDSKLYTYLVQFDNVNKKIGKCKYFQIEDLSNMAKSVQSLNVKPFGVSFSMGLLDSVKTKTASNGNEIATRASAKDIVAIPCLWCDIDFQDPNHADPNLFSDLGSALSMLESKLKPIGLYPNIIVNSGHGIHAYWIFERCILTHSDSEKQYAKSILTKIQSIIRHFADGKTIDKTDNLDRVLRISGSKNWKGDPDLESAPVATVIFDDGNSFNVDDLTSRINLTLDELQPHSSVTSPISDRNMRAVDKMRNRGISESLVSTGNCQLMIENCKFIQFVLNNFDKTPEPIIKNALSNFLHADGSREVIIDLVQKRFGADFDISKTNERLNHYLLHSKPTSCQVIRESCNVCNVDSCIVSRLGKKCPAAIVTSNDVLTAIESEKKSLFDFVDDLPVELHDFKIPIGYAISNLGIFDLKANKYAIRSLVFISKITTDADLILSDGVNSHLASKDFFTLLIRKNHRWINIVTTPDLLQDSKTVTKELSKYGVNIDSNTAKFAVSYFTEFKVKNEFLIPHIDRFTKTGWHDNYFIIPRENATYEIAAGEVVKEIYQRGSRDKFIDLLQRALKFKAVKIFVAASLAATIIKKINCRNFTICIYARTGTGKTAALRLSAAIWGSPNYMTQLNATTNAIEAVAVDLNDLPLLANELQVMNQKTREQLGEFIHRFEIGRGKIRLNRSVEMRPIKFFNGIMCITAEQPLATDNAVGGVLTRIFDVPVDVAIGEFDSSTKQYKTDNDLCREIYQSTEENFGFIGPEFVQKFIDNPDEFNSVKSEFDNWRMKLLSERNDEISASHADYIAALTITFHRLNRWFFDLDDFENEVATQEFAFDLLADLKTKTELSDTTRALNYLRDWYLQYYNNFYSSKNPTEFPKEYFGFFHIEQLCVIPKVLNAALESGGFSSAKILREFLQEGIIQGDSKEKSSKLLRDPISNKPSRFIVFNKFFDDEENHEIIHEKS